MTLFYNKLGELTMIFNFYEKFKLKKYKAQLLMAQEKIEYLQNKIPMDQSEKIVLEKDLIREFKHYQKYANKYLDTMIGSTLSPYEKARNEYYAIKYYIALLDSEYLRREKAHVQS